MRRDRRSSPSAPIAPTTTGRSPKGSWSAKPSVAPGITPVSICAPAKRCARRRFSPLAVWKVEQRGRPHLRARKARTAAGRASKRAGDAPGKIVIVGGGAAGFAAAEMLRRQDYRGSIVMLSNDDAAPVDRPNLSKDYLAGSAPEDWLPLRPDDFYAEHGIDLRLKTEVTAIDTATREVVLGRRQTQFPTTGCCWRPAPSRCGCRSRAPTSRMSTRCARWPTAARSSHVRRRRAPRGRDRRELHRPRGRGVAARPRISRSTWSAPEQRPMERVLGPEMGDFVRALHEEHGVIFHLGDTVTAIDGKQRDAQERRRARSRSRGRRRRRAAAARAGREGRACDRPRRHRRCLSRNQRARRLRGRRHRALARPAFRREHSRRALGGGGAPGPDRGAQHARAARDASTPCRSSGASTTTCRSTMSATPRSGTRSRSTAISRARIACCATSATAACSPSPRSTAMSKASRPSWRWRRERIGRLAQGQKMSLHVTPGLAPGIDVFKPIHKQERRGWLDIGQTEATPSF